MWRLNWFFLSTRVENDSTYSVLSKVEFGSERDYSEYTNIVEMRINALVFHFA